MQLVNESTTACLFHWSHPAWHHTNPFLAESLTVHVLGVHSVRFYAGSIPTEIGQVIGFTHLDFKNNQLTGACKYIWLTNHSFLIKKH